MTFNFASLLGVLLLLFSLPSEIFGIFQIYFILQRRADTSPAVLIKTMFTILLTLSRLIVVPLIGIGFLLYGWRLDGIFQFIAFLLASGLVFESASNSWDDYRNWRFRTGRAAAKISVDSQPSDLVE